MKRIIQHKVTPWISLAIGLLITAFIMMIVIFRTDFFANTAGDTFSRYLFSGTDFRLSIGKLSGNPMKHIEIRDFRVRFEGEEFAFDIMRIDRIELVYSLSSLMSGTPSLTLVELDSPHIWVKPDSSGINILPHMAGEGAGLLPVFDVERFVLKEGQVIIQGPLRADALKDIYLEGSAKSDGHIVKVGLAGGRAEDLRRDIFLRSARGRVGYVHSEKVGEVHAAREGEVLIDSLYIELDESSLIADGVIDPDSMIFDLRINAFPLNVEEVTRLANIETSHFGELQGPIHIKGSPARFSVDSELNGIFSGYALERFTLLGEWAPPVFRISKGKGLFNGAVVDGSGFYSFESPPVLVLDAEAGGLDLSRGFSRGASLPSTDLNGAIKLTYYSRTSEMLFECDLGEGNIRDFPYDTAVIRGSRSPDSLEFEYIALDSPTHSIRSHGSIADDDLRVYVDLSCSKEDTLFSYLGIEEYRGDVDLNGIISGTFDEWELRCNGSFKDFVYQRAIVPSGEIKLLVNKDDSYGVQLELTGDSCVIGPVDFSSVLFSLEYGAGVASFNRFFLSRPGFDAELRGEVRNSGEESQIEFSEVLVSALDEQWRSNGAFTVILTDSGIDFDDLQLHSRAGALYLDCTINDKDESIGGVFAFDRMDLALLNSSGLIDQKLEGRGRGTIAVDGRLADPGVVVDLFIHEGRFDTIGIDSMRLNAAYTPGGSYAIENYRLMSPLGELGVDGRLSGCSLRRLIEEGGTALEEYAVDLVASCKDLSLEPFLGFSENIPFDRGFFTGRVIIGDSLLHPSASMNGSIRDLSRDNLKVPLCELEAALGKDRVTLRGNIHIDEKHGGNFSGRIPIRWEKRFYSIDTEGDIFLELYKPSGPLEDITRVTDLVAEANGSFSAGFKIEGPIKDPVILGDLRLEKAGFRLAGMEERFRDVDASILLEDTLITIKRLRGKEGKNGSFEGSGTIGLKGWRPASYDIDVSLDKCLVASIPDVIAIASGKIHTGTEIIEGKPVPSLTGDLEVNRAEIFLVFDELTSTSPGGTFTPSWLAEIDLDIPGNAWIKTPDSNVEMQGEITLHHDHRGTYLRGTLDLVRGWYNVYGNKFTVNSGKLEFVHAGGFRPVINIEAETLDPEGRKIFLSLVWLQDDVEPKVTLVHEDPGYSETDIWKMLGGGIVGSPGGQDASWDAFGTAQSLAANYIERILNSQMQGITIELETEGTKAVSSNGMDQKQTMVAVGKYLSEGLYVKYKQGLAISTVRQIEVEYRISRLFMLRTQLIRYSEAALQGESSRSTDEYNVDLKLRWEF